MILLLRKSCPYILKLKIKYSITLIFYNAWPCHHVRGGQRSPAGVGSLLPCEAQISNSGCQVGLAASTFTHWSTSRALKTFYGALILPLCKCPTAVLIEGQTTYCTTLLPRLRILTYRNSPWISCISTNAYKYLWISFVTKVLAPSTMKRSIDIMSPTG